MSIARSRGGTLARSRLVLLAVVLAAAGRRARTEPSPSPSGPDAAFAASLDAVARRADARGLAEVAALVRDWPLREPDDRQPVLVIPPRLEPPAAIDTPDEQALWEDFVTARRTRAEARFREARTEAAAHDRVASREERARPPDPDRPPLEQRTCAVITLLHRVLRDDPDHAQARAALGWTRRNDAWIAPEAARRLDRGDEFDPDFGWLARGRLARYRRGERFDRGRWLDAAEDAGRVLTLERGRHFDSDHWEILSTAPLESAAALAARLEETLVAWRQVFGGCGLDPDDLETRLTGRDKATPHEPHAAVLCADRNQYVAELSRLVPRVGDSSGLYWPPTRTAWFFDAAGHAADAVTVRHEATHQLFAEIHPEFRRTPAPAGERCGFWAVEAAACHMESMRPAAFGWTVGGRDAGRVPAARRRLLEEGFHVPLAELAALGREAFQADPRLPSIYDEIAGLADFFMNGRGGRYRESFVEYLSRVYAGTAEPGTLPRLCSARAADLDDEYRRYLREAPLGAEAVPAG